MGERKKMQTFLKDFPKINFDALQCLSLGFVDRHRPREDKWQLNRVDIVRPTPTENTRTRTTYLTPANLHLPTWQLNFPSLIRNQNFSLPTPRHRKLNNRIWYPTTYRRTRTLLPAPASTSPRPITKLIHPIKCWIDKPQHLPHAPIHKRIIHIFNEHYLRVDAQAQYAWSHEVAEHLATLVGVLDRAAVGSIVVVCFSAELVGPG
jgi:hypothetical protein